MGESGDPSCGRGGGPEAEFGFATELEGGEFARAGVVPGEELPGCVVVFPGIEITQEGGRCESAGTEIEDEVYECVELALRERDMDETGDGRFRDADVVGEDGFGLSHGDPIRETLGGGEPMTEADGLESGNVRIGVFAKAFAFFEELESGGR